MSVGYSGTPLPRKLGIKAGHVVATIDEPGEFRGLVDDLPPDVVLRAGLDGGADIVMLFTTQRASLEHQLPGAADAVFPDGAIWVAWPKKSAKVPTDVTEDVVRDVALPMRLVDNKVCAISDVWSGLRLVWRREHRR